MVTILTGANSYALRAELRRLIDKFTADVGGPDVASMAIEQLDGEEASFERMQEALQSLPFLVSRKLVILRTPGANKVFAEKVEGLVKELPETTDVIIIEPKLDKRLSYYKFLKKRKGFQEFGELDERGLAQWLVRQADEKGTKISSSDASYLIGRVGANQQKLASELEKLSLYAGSEAIGREAIDALTVPTPQSTIFELLEAAFAGNTKRALALYAEQRALKVEPQQIIAMLAWQLHILAIIKAAGSDRSIDTIARDAKLNPYGLRRSASVARGLSLGRVRELVSELTILDERLKRESLNPDETLLNYLVNLSR